MAVAPVSIHSRLFKPGELLCLYNEAIDGLVSIHSRLFKPGEFMRISKGLRLTLPVSIHSRLFKPGEFKQQ